MHSEYDQDESKEINTKCMAFTNKGNPCRYRRKNLSDNFCGIHSKPNERIQQLRESIQESKIALQSNLESEYIETKSIPITNIPNIPNNITQSENRPVYTPKCNQFTARGTQCKNKAYLGFDGMCLRHYNMAVSPNTLRPRNYATRPRIEEIIQDDEKLIDDLVREDEFKQMMSEIARLSVQEHEYNQSNSTIFRSQIGAQNNVNNVYKTNMKTLRECECDICAEQNKRMIMLYCCRKEMCADCMKKITNSKCPFCKQDNNMLID
jgi:hypothetical protein